MYVTNPSNAAIIIVFEGEPKGMGLCFNGQVPLLSILRLMQVMQHGKIDTESICLACVY